MHVLVSALRKLARVSIPPRDFLAYRLPGARTSDPETGAAGVQLPFLSATRNRRVAVERALARIEREAARVCGVAGERLQQEGKEGGGGGGGGAGGGGGGGGRGRGRVIRAGLIIRH